MAENMKVFISWSKERSKRVAVVLQEFLPQFTEGVEYFVSDKDIDPGERSMKTVEAELDGTNYGLLIVTPENQSESWLNFEAGALSKHVVKDPENVPRVVPVLVAIKSPSQLTGPISQFQAVKLDQDGIERIILSIARLSGSSETVVKKRFDRTWDELALALTEAAESTLAPQSGPKRSDGDKLDEVLEILRSLRRSALIAVDIDDDLDLRSTGGTFNKSKLRLTIDREAARHDFIAKEFKVSSRTGRPLSLVVTPAGARKPSIEEFHKFVDNLQNLIGVELKVEMAQS